MRAERLPGYTFGRLAWRPAALIAGPIMIGLLMFPIYGVPDNPGNLFGPISARISEEKIRFFLWQAAVVLPGIAAFFLGLATHEVRQSGISWMIPRYRARLVPPAVLVGVPFILVPAVVAVRETSPTLGLGMLGLGVLSFSLAWRSTDRTVAARSNTMGVVLLFALFLNPAFVDGLFMSEPIGVATLTAVVGIAWWLPEISPQTNRQLVVNQPKMPGEAIVGRGSQTFTTSVSARTPAGRLYAGLYESPGGAFGHFRALTLQALFVGLFAVAVGSAGMVAMFPMLFSVLMGTQLKDVFPYPMSRRDRANAFFAASLLDTSIAAMVAAGSALLLSAVGLWRDGVHPEGPGHALMSLLFLFLLAPIGQSVQAGRNLTPTRKNKVSAVRMMISLAVTMLWFGAAQGAAKVFADSVASMPRMITAIGVVASFVAIQAIYLIGLRWYFARRDFN
jgi:hypothetical protein